MAKKLTFLDILAKQLAGEPEASRLVIAIDPKNFLDLPNPVLDSADRDWVVFYYDKNDLKLRNFLTSFPRDEKRLLIIARTANEKQHELSLVDLSYIPDLVEEATNIIDCSPEGLLSAHVKEQLPDDLYDDPLLSLWSDNINNFLRNLSKYQKIAGKGVVLNKFDAMAVALSSSIPDINLEEIANMPSDSLARTIFYLKSLISFELNNIEIKVLQNMIIGAESDKQIKAWCRIEKPSLIRFLYLISAAIRYAVPNAQEELQRLALFDIDIKPLGDAVENIITAISEDLEFKKSITIKAEESTGLINDIDKLVSIFKFGSFEDSIKAFYDESCPAIACGLGRKILRWLVPTQEGKNALSKCSESRTEDIYPKTPYTKKADQFKKIISNISWLELSINQAPEPEKNLLDLINIYRSANLHLLELKCAEVAESLRIIKEKEIKKVLQPYFEEAQEKIDKLVFKYDKALADIISSDFKQYASFIRLNTQILRNLIQADNQRKERVWIIILDGMRLDTWDNYVWPRLREIFEIEGEEQLYLSALPSYTDISRVSFLAGKLPAFWKDYYNNYTSDHNILLSRHLSLGREESKKKIKILTRVEEKAEKSDLDFGNAQYRCLIFNISDDWIHKEHGSLIRVNEIVEEKFKKMVYPELVYRVKPEDIVIVTSDHGFIELRNNFGHEVEVNSKNEIEVDKINYRYIEGNEYKKGVRVNYRDIKTWMVAVGYQWFSRPKPTGKRARYSHGGISMAEMVVPAVRLKKKTEKKIEITVFVDTPLECYEGETVRLPIHIKNQGTIEANVSLECRQAGRLVAEKSINLPEGTSYSWIVSAKADLKAHNISIIAQYTLPNKEKKKLTREMSLPIIDKGGKVEIDTSALDVFEDLD